MWDEVCAIASHCPIEVWISTTLKETLHLFLIIHAADESPKKKFIRDFIHAQRNRSHTHECSVDDGTYPSFPRRFPALRVSNLGGDTPGSLRWLQIAHAGRGYRS